MVMHIGLLELQNDLTPADWIVDRIHDFAVDVGSIIPEGFESYTRLFHPAHRTEGDGEVPVQWSEIAEANGRTIHPEMQWPNISGVWEHTGEPSPGLWDDEPEFGSLPRLYAERLSELLPGHTSTPDRVWFCVWDGWGGLKIHPVGGGVILRRKHWTDPVVKRIQSMRRMAPFKPPAPTLELPGRPYYLFSGPLGSITESVCKPPCKQSASLWWPDDRAWCVATEIDFAWTYIGGSGALIQALVDDPDLEAIPAQIDDGIGFDADHINPLPPRR